MFKCCSYVPYRCVGGIIFEVEGGSGAYQVFVEVELKHGLFDLYSDDFADKSTK